MNEGGICKQCGEEWHVSGLVCCCNLKPKSNETFWCVEGDDGTVLLEYARRSKAESGVEVMSVAYRSERYIGSLKSRLKQLRRRISEFRYEKSSQEDGTGGEKMSRFVNIDGYWINPEFVESVEHLDATAHSPQAVVIRTRTKTFRLPDWTPRDACRVVDKLEATPSAALLHETRAK